MLKRCAFVAAVVLAAGSALAQDKAAAKTEAKQESRAVEMPKLMVGDKAPPLKVAKFVKGEPVTGFEKGKTYVVEFWATWCGPCKMSIPHLTELQEKNKDVTIIGVSVWENDQTKVEPFVKDEMGDKMVYTVAMDEVPPLADDIKPGSKEAKSWSVKKGTMAQTWMDASGWSKVGIPTAFVVNGDGKIAWAGHPRSPEGELDRVIEMVKSGKQDLAADAAAYREATAKRVQEQAEAAKKAEENRKEAGLDKAKEDRLAEPRAKLAKALQGKDGPGAVKAMEEIMEISPALAKQQKLGELKYRTLLLECKDYDKAYAYGRELLAGDGKDDAQTQNDVAWFIVDPDNKPQKQDMKLAEAAALRAVELSKNENGAIMDTLAAVYYAKGDFTKAADTQKKALDLVIEKPPEGLPEAEIAGMKARLDMYKAAAKKGGS